MSQRWRGCLLEIVETVLLTVVIFFLVQHFVAQPYQILQVSMEHTLEPDQMVLVDKISPVFSPYKRGDVIVVYDGQHISQQTLDARYGDDDVAAPYAVETHGDVEDAALRRGAGAICNHATGPAQNARIVYRGNRHIIVATKQIFNGTEVLVNYGHNYWDGGNGTYSTKAR